MRSSCPAPGIAVGVETDNAHGRSTPPTIYDVARTAGVSIASVSRVLNGHRNPREETRRRVLQAVAELGFIPDGAARALNGRLKQVVGVVIRRVRWEETSAGVFTEEYESLQFPDVINRGIELAAQRRGFDLLVPCQASFASARMAQTRRSGAVQLGAIPCGSVASELQSP
jgi:DNA-binding LacI/PurR family transcriptional regulator